MVIRRLREDRVKRERLKRLVKVVTMLRTGKILKKVVGIWMSCWLKVTCLQIDISPRSGSVFV